MAKKKDDYDKPISGIEQLVPGVYKDDEGRIYMSVKPVNLDKQPEFLKYVRKDAVVVCVPEGVLVGLAEQVIDTGIRNLLSFIQEKRKE